MARRALIHGSGLRCVNHKGRKASATMKMQSALLRCQTVPTPKMAVGYHVSLADLKSDKHGKTVKIIVILSILITFQAKDFYNVLVFSQLKKNVFLAL